MMVSTNPRGLYLKKAAISKRSALNKEHKTCVPLRASLFIYLFIFSITILVVEVERDLVP